MCYNWAHREPAAPWRHIVMAFAMLHYRHSKINARMTQPSISVAPMMGCTDRHFRYLLRLISPRALLYTEMVTTGALLNNDPERFLQHTQDTPCALQLGGNQPDALGALRNSQRNLAIRRSISMWAAQVIVFRRAA